MQKWFGYFKGQNLENGQLLFYHLVTLLPACLSFNKKQ